MVLVMVSCTVCLYAGLDSSMRTSYPRNIMVDITAENNADIDSNLINSVDNAVNSALKENNETGKDKISYRITEFSANQNGNNFTIIKDDYYSNSSYNILIVPIEDYNKLMGQNETLGENEVLVFTAKLSNYKESTLNIDSTGELKIKNMLMITLDTVVI